MAIFHSQRTDYLSQKQARYAKASKILIYLFLCIAGLLAAIFLTIFQKEGLLALIIVFIFTLFMGWNVFRLGHKDIRKYLRGERNYGSGSMGEELTEVELRKLPDTFHVFCDLVIPGKRGNLDFVVVGPNAIFLIDVKNSSGKVYYSEGGVYSGRFGLNYISVMHKEVLQLNEYLRGPLKNYSLVPILLFSNKNAYVSVKQSVESIHVIHLRQLNNFLLKNNASPHNTERVLEVLKPLSLRFE